MDQLQAWSMVDVLTLREAARIAAGVDPQKEILPWDIEADPALPYLRALVDAVEAGRLHVVRYLTSRDGGLVAGRPGDPAANETRVRAQDVATFFQQRGGTWPSTTTSSVNVASLPQEIRIAIEAFQAVSRDSLATSGRSPRQAILTWLKQHFPDLPQGARDRIATVANWQPGGGAPKTPG